MSGMKDAFFGDRPYSESPGYKERTTSKDAARAVSGRAGAMREQVFTVIASHGDLGRTADEVATALGETVLAVRPRVSELATAKRIVPNGQKRTNDSGLKAKVWVRA